MDKTVIRTAVLSDTERLLEIYAYYVENTTITFKYDVPSVMEFQNRMEKILQKYPYIVAQQNNRIVGYAYAGSFVGRKAYNWSAELTVYVDKNYHRCGIGRELYKVLEDILKKMGITNLYACISVSDSDDEYLTSNSIDFHNHLGFKKVGEFHECGYKFNRWYNMAWAEKIIGEHCDNKKDIVYFNKLDYNF